jgi:pyruvate,water dikinase
MLTQDYTAHQRETGETVAFPVTWPDAEDANRLWRWDAEHTPFPLTPLSQEFRRGPGGPPVAVESLGGVVAPGRPSPEANGYRYAEARGLDIGKQPAAFYENLAAMSVQAEELWERGWRLEIEARAREIAAVEYDSLSLQDQIARFQSLVEVSRQNMSAMFRASFLVTSCRSRLLEFCGQNAGEAAETMVTDLLQGTPTESLDSGAALWDVAQILKHNPALLDRLRAEPDAEGLKNLGSLDGGAEFITAFLAWLDRYGHRNGSFGELAEPSWIEEPRVPLALAIQYTTEIDPRQGKQKAIDQRKAVQESFERQLGDPELIERFRDLLTAASPYLGIRESRDHAVNMFLIALRVPALAIGRSLVARGAINQADDSFFLEFTDLDAAAADPKLDLRALVAGRRQSHDYWCNVLPPTEIGNIAARPASQPGVIRGVGASRGSVTAKARVIMRLDEAYTLQAGEVLVARGTSPAWTALFGTAAAVVTEGGGMLSHCAIVAREYGIPAVVGAAGASGLIRTGAVITVDGTQGLITIEPAQD